MTATPGQRDPVHLMTIEMGAWCGATGPGNGRASSAWREVTCTECLAKGAARLRSLVWDMLQPMPASREAFAFAVRAGRLGVVDEHGRPLAMACATDAIAAQEPHAAPELGDWPAILADVTQQRDDLRELLDEVGVLAANAPEDDGSFAVCEEIAMRIAAVDVPDTTPIDEWPDPENPVTGRTVGAAAPELAAAPEVRITDCTDHDGASHVQINTRNHWLCTVSLAPILHDYEPQPEPLVAPELRAALDEPRELRKVITELLSMFRGISGGYGARTSSSRLRKIAARAGVHWAGLTALPAPDTTEAAETNRLRDGLENVFAVLDRQTLTFAERVSRARTLIRASLEGES